MRLGGLWVGNGPVITAFAAEGEKSPLPAPGADYASEAAVMIHPLRSYAWQRLAAVCQTLSTVCCP